MPINNPEELFTRELGVMLGAENQFVKATQQMAQNVTNPQLKDALQAHVRQTETQVENLRKAFKELGREAKEVESASARALVEDYQKVVRELQADNLKDITTTASASKVEHFEIAAYRGLIVSAQQMGKSSVVNLLQENLRMEEATAQKVEDMMRNMQQGAR